MSPVADRYRRLAASFTDRVASVEPADWSNPSPCEGWTALDVVQHVVDSEASFLGTVGRELDGVPSVGDDPLAAWATVRDTVQACLDDPVVATTTYTGFFGETTFEATVDRFYGMDLVVHGWDLARAAGLDERIDPDEARRVLADAAELGDALRTPGVCGPAVEPPTGADDQARLLAFLGRQP
jgi:uncharacterized protein (TIGR03086 family)